jgi:hypothetical protein
LRGDEHRLRQVWTSQFVPASDDRNYEALYRLGVIRIQQGRFGDAAKLSGVHRRWSADSPTPFTNLAFQHSRAGCPWIYPWGGRRRAVETPEGEVYRCVDDAS